MTTTAKLAVATSILSLLLGMLIGQQATKEKYQYHIPSYIVYTPKETREKIQIRDILMSVYSIDIIKADWLADNVFIAKQLYGVPTEKMLALISVESKFDEYAISNKNAIGFTQVRPSVWANEIPYDVYVPADNILAGAHILNNYRIECGNWDCALKAYNVGITNFKAGKKQSAAKRYAKKIKSEIERIYMARNVYIEPRKG